MDTNAFGKYLYKPQRIRLLVRDSVTSTNLLVKELGAQGAPEGTLMVASEQTQGRGRLGRRFESPKGTGLYATLLLRPELPLAQSLQITILTAVAVAEGIEAAAGLGAGTTSADDTETTAAVLRPEIKWVNDIYLDNRKICGILAESTLVPCTDRIAYTALGFGINLEEPQGGFTGTAAGVAGALYPYGEMPEGFRERVLAEVVNRILRYYDELVSAADDTSSDAAASSDTTGIAPAARELSYMARYRASDYLFGKDVWLLDDITKPDNARPAHAVAIDAEGRLIVTLPGGTTEAVVSGDVTVRIASGPDIFRDGTSAQSEE